MGFFCRVFVTAFIAVLLPFFLWAATPSPSHSSSAGQIDLSLWGEYRSFPVTGVAEAVVGYDHLLWGDSKNPFYGYARAYAEFDAITQYQGVTLKAEVFPISILGVRVGQGWSQNHEDLSSFNCGTDLCTGFFSQQFVEGVLYLGAGPIKFSGTYRYINMHLDSAAEGFTYYIDPDSGLEIATNSTDYLWRTRGTLAYEINPHLRLGYALTLYDSDTSDEKSTLWMGFAQVLTGPINVILGGGEYYSSILTTRSTFVAIGQWTIYPHLGY